VDDAESAAGEIELLVDGLNDDVSLVWALIRLGIRSNPDERPGWKPSQDDLQVTFESFRRLIAATPQLQHDGGGPPGRLVPHEHVSENNADIRDRVDREVASAARESDRAYACWLANTPKGDEVAREAISDEQ
jgi:hypothetical protein